MSLGISPSFRRPVSILLLQVDLVHAPFSLFKPLAAAPAALSADAALLSLRVVGFVIVVVVAQVLL